MAPKLKSPERVNLLKWGESLRENPGTILLSVPVFVISLIVKWLQHDQEGMAASWGHLGITYKNYYKHNWQNPLLLKKALFCFERSAKLAKGNGVPTVYLKCAETANQLKRYDQAGRYFQIAVKDDPESLYLHIWYTQALIILGEYYLAIGNKQMAEKYAQQALAHSQKYDLRFRIHDAEMLIKKIND